VDALSPEERDLLAYLLESDGRTSVGNVTRRYGSDEGDGWFWDEEPPTSTLGRVRLHGLAFVGIDASSGRRMRTVLVPRELRDMLRAALAKRPDGEWEGLRAGTEASGRGTRGASPPSPHEPRPDVRRALEGAFPTGVIEPLWFEDAWLHDAWERLEEALARLPRARLLHRRPPLEATDWSLVIDDEDDYGDDLEDDEEEVGDEGGDRSARGRPGREDEEDESERISAREEAEWDDEERESERISAREEAEWDDEELSYGIFFVGPVGDGFRFDFDSEFPDEEGRLHPVKCVGHIGWTVAVSAVAPFALLRLRSLDIEDGVVLPPGIEPRMFDDRGRPQSEALFLREMLDASDAGELDDLRERIVEVLRDHGIATLSDEELTVGVPWLGASDEVLIATAPERRVSVEDGLFFRWI